MTGNFVSAANGPFGFGGTTTMFGTPGGAGGAEGFVQTSGNGPFDQGSFMNTGRGGTGQAMLDTGNWFGRNQSQYIETPDGFIQISGGGPFGRGQNILVQTANYTYSKQGGDGFWDQGSTVYRPNAGVGSGGTPVAVQNGSVPNTTQQLPGTPTQGHVYGPRGTVGLGPVFGKLGHVGIGPVFGKPGQHGADGVRELLRNLQRFLTRLGYGGLLDSAAGAASGAPQKMGPPQKVGGASGGAPMKTPIQVG